MSRSSERAHAPGRAAVWGRMIGLGTMSMLVVAPLVGGVGWLTGGPVVALSALAGVALTGAFLLAGLLGLRLVLNAHEAMVVPGVLSILAFQILALMALWTEGRSATSFLSHTHAPAFGAGALAAAIVWQAVLVGVLTRTRQLIYTGAPAERMSEREGGDR